MLKTKVRCVEAKQKTQKKNFQNIILNVYKTWFWSNIQQILLPKFRNSVWMWYKLEQIEENAFAIKHGSLYMSV